MSRAYGMNVSIAAFRPERSEAIREAAQEEWPFESWLECEGSLMAQAESQLGGGESEEEFAARLAQAVWKANGSFCPVEVAATYLEDLPYEQYIFDEDDFDRFIEAQASAAAKGHSSIQEASDGG